MSTERYGRRQWSREELLLAMNLYCRIPFGRQHSRSREVAELAKVLNRSPSSVAMKLNNFTSLDPTEAARGIRGLSGASKLDKQVWDEFHSDWQALAAESEELWRQRVGLRFGHDGESADDQIQPEETGEGHCRVPMRQSAGPTEGYQTVKVRYAQGFFRRSVLAAYNYRCCISGIPVPELLVASHILSWSRFPNHRVNPRNGLCLSRLHDAAYDSGFITLNEERRLVLSPALREYMISETLRRNFLPFEGKPIHLPEKFLPDADFLRRHRDEIFRRE
jgi:hypothetical protein